MPIITPLKANRNASAEDEKAAVPTVEGTIPIHADLVFSAGIIPKATTFEYTVGGTHGAAAIDNSDRKVYVHLPMTKGGKVKIRIDGREDAVLSEGDGAFVENVKGGDVLSVENTGKDEEAEVVVLDSKTEG